MLLPVPLLHYYQITSADFVQEANCQLDTLLACLQQKFFRKQIPQF